VEEGVVLQEEGVEEGVAVKTAFVVQCLGDCKKGLFFNMGGVSAWRKLSDVPFVHCHATLAPLGIHTTSACAQWHM